MAIVCDVCTEEKVLNNGDICDSCKNAQIEANTDRSYLNKVYLPNDLYKEFVEHVKSVENEEKDSKKLFGRFMNKLKTSFINKVNGKEINDPTPMTIIPKHSTVDRIQNILNHNLSVYAEKNNMETPETLNDFSVDDNSSELFETSIHQHVDEIMLMEDETIKEFSPPEQGEIPEVEDKETPIEKEE